MCARGPGTLPAWRLSGGASVTVVDISKEIIELGGEGSEDERRKQGVAMLRQLSVEERAQLRTLLETARERAERAGEIPPSLPS
jgi:hypothetical protein